MTNQKVAALPCSDLFCTKPAELEPVRQESAILRGKKATLLSVFPPDRFLFGIQHIVIDLPGLHFQVAADAVGNGLIQFM